MTEAETDWLKKHFAMALPRCVLVVFAVPGLGSQSAIYDQLCLADMMTWRANTSPPAIQLSVSPASDEMLTRWAAVRAAIISARSRDGAKNLRKVPRS